MNTYTVCKGTVIFSCASDTPEALDLAKQYIILNQMTSEDVGIYRQNGSISIIAKQTVEILI